MTGRDGAVRVGVISDTHGMLDPRVPELFAGVDHIVHAGDIGPAWILDRLREIAPVTAVAGNCDTHGELGWALRGVERIVLGGVPVTVVHDIDTLPREHADHGVIVHGHTHEAAFEEVPGQWRLNPGSARWPQEGRPRTVAVLTLDGGRASAEILELPEGGG